jgi:hypothetical protein
MLTRDEIPDRISELLDGRPTRWTPAERLLGDYDGRERTLDVFDAHAVEQRSLLRQLRPLRGAIEQVIGGPLIVLFHTPRETRRLYPNVQCVHRGPGAGTAQGLSRLPVERRPAEITEHWPAEHAPDPRVADPPYEEAA